MLDEREVSEPVHWWHFHIDLSLTRTQAVNTVITIVGTFSSAIQVSADHLNESEH